MLLIRAWCSGAGVGSRAGVCPVTLLDQPLPHPGSMMPGHQALPTPPAFPSVALFMVGPQIQARALVGCWWLLGRKRVEGRQPVLAPLQCVWAWGPASQPASKAVGVARKAGKLEQPWKQQERDGLRGREGKGGKERDRWENRGEHAQEKAAAGRGRGCCSACCFTVLLPKPEPAPGSSLVAVGSRKEARGVEGVVARREKGRGRGNPTL